MWSSSKAGDRPLTCVLRCGIAEGKRPAVTLVVLRVQGMDDRYDGSGWTTFRKPAPPKKEKVPRKPRAEGEGRKRKSAEEKEKEGGGGGGGGKALPKWYRGVPRCPELTLPLHADVLLQPEDIRTGKGAGEAGEAGAGGEAGKEEGESTRAS
eukprot:2045554-Rhodomonas_salina.1